jgi:hypothetical protein
LNTQGKLLTIGVVFACVFGFLIWAKTTKTGNKSQLKS